MVTELLPCQQIRSPMSSHYSSKKGFKKLAASDDLAVEEPVMLDDGSELELLDLTSLKHRRPPSLRHSAARLRWVWFTRPHTTLINFHVQLWVLEMAFGVVRHPTDVCGGLRLSVCALLCLQHPPTADQTRQC